MGDSLRPRGRRSEELLFENDACEGRDCKVMSSEITWFRHDSKFSWLQLDLGEEGLEKFLSTRMSQYCYSISVTQVLGRGTGMLTLHTGLTP